MKLLRRTALLGLATSAAVGSSRLALAAAPTDKRLVVVILRGALDGMAAVVPYGDPDLVGLRGQIVPASPGEADGLLDLGGFFGLHPALTELHNLYATNEALAVHAVAGPYRVRSHFEAQDYLESGADHRMTSGWLNRVVSELGEQKRGETTTRRWRSVSQSRCCCGGRRRWQTGRHMDFPNRHRTFMPRSPRSTKPIRSPDRPSRKDCERGDLALR